MMHKTRGCCVPGAETNIIRRKAMLKTQFTKAVLLSVATAACLLATTALQPADAQERKSIRLATSAVGSYGYAIGATMTKVIEQALGSDYAVTVQPYTSPTVAMKAVMDGNGEVAYTADIGMTEFHTRTSGFKGYKPKMPELAHTWYAYPMESMMATSAKFAGKFKCWRDFSGQPVFYTNAGFMNWLNWRRIYDTLGYKFNHVQIDLNSNADAMQRGTVVGSATYTTSGRDLAAYWKETEIRTDIRVVNPCPDEIAKLKAAGLAVVDVDPKGAFTKPVGPSTIQGVPILFGYNVRLDMSEDMAYRILNAFYKGKDELAKQTPGFSAMAKDFIGMQAQGINANPEVPVHPGLARFLKEHKAWNDKWKVGKS
jgi:TRAP transporter TAXI family solute receptor